VLVERGRKQSAERERQPRHRFEREPLNILNEKKQGTMGG